MNTKNNSIKNLILTMVFVLGAATVFIFGCPFKGLTGIPCPGCGMTRACLAALHLHFAEAFWYHPLFPLVFLCAAFLGFRAVRYVVKRPDHLRGLGTGDLSAALSSMIEAPPARVVCLCAIVAFLIVYVLRLLHVF